MSLIRIMAVLPISVETISSLPPEFSDLKRVFIGLIVSIIANAAIKVIEHFIKKRSARALVVPGSEVFDHVEPTPGRLKRPRIYKPKN